MNVLDLFSGAGGLTEGFLQEDFKVIAHIEKEAWACETLKTRICYHYLKEKNDLELYHKYLKGNYNYKNLDEGRKIFFDKYPELKEKLEYEVLNKTFGNPANDESTTSTSEIKELIEKSMAFSDVEQIDLIIGGPPCQAYSVIGRSRMKEAVKKDKRNFLFYYYKELVDYFRPRIFLFENVPGILTAQKGMIFPKIQEEFDEIGYHLLSGPSDDHYENIVNSLDYGVHQNRKRVILFGFKKGLNLSYPDFQKYSLKDKLGSELTTKNAISDLPKLTVGQGDDSRLFDYPELEANSLSEFQKLMRQDSFGVVNHKARMHRKKDLEIYQIAIKLSRRGEKLKYPDLPEYLKTHKNEKNFQDRFKVHGLSDLPHTIVAHISKDGHYNIHPDIDQCRSLTVREAARIQSFPDNFKFEGPRTAQFTQVGNAVPPLMSIAFAKTIKNDYS